MLIFTRLTVQDFGPYRGRQTMDFSHERGVYIVYGRNGRGKTTLHNAFRYSLYGQILGRHRQELAKDLANSEARKQAGYASFETGLEFRHDGTKYKLVRKYDERERPSELMLLEREGIPLSLAEAEKTLQTIAPPSISQFYLFDGEQLRQYEELLDLDSEQGQNLERAIEHVLGIPIVENARNDVAWVGQQANKQLASQYKAHAETERMGRALEEAQEVKSRLQADHNEIEWRVEESKQRLEEIEGLLREQQKAQRKLGQLDELRAKEEDLRRDRTAAEAALNDLSPDLWKNLLAPSASAHLARLDEDFEKAEAELLEAAAAVRDVAHLKSEHDDCPVCHRDISEDLRLQLVAELEVRAASGRREELEAERANLRQKRKVLEGLSRRDASLVMERDRQLRAIQLDLQQAREDCEEIERDLANVSEEELRVLAGERTERQAQMSREKDRLKKSDEDIREQDQQIDRFKRSLKMSQTVKPDPTVELKDQLATELASLFGAAIEAYRSKLRFRVEERASEIFREMTSERDYEALRITDRYGLEILDKDGEVVRRSAGYEHLVALSLIAALQRSAAVRAPVVMDYPFGRLDPDNTSRVVAALPRMADQVVLLSFEGEFDREAALRALDGNLAAEYRLEHVTSKHTRIEPWRSL